MKDYCEFAKTNYANGVGIYLTLNGDAPGSIDPLTSSTNSFKIVCLSYWVILQWLECCCKDEEVIEHKHVLSAVEQYIIIIRKQLKIMEENKKAILNLFTENSKNI